MNVNIKVLSTIGVRGAVAFGNFLLPILIAQYYGLKDLGIFVTIISTITLIHIVLKFGMDKTIMREVAKLKNIKEYIKLSFKVFVLVFISLLFLSFIFNNYLKLENLLFVLLTSIPYTILILNSTILQALGRPDQGLAFNPGLSSLIICVLLFFLNINFNINDILNIYASILWLMLLISLIVIFPLISRCDNSQKLEVSWRKTYLYNSGVFFIISIFIFSQQISLTFTLNYFESIEVVGMVRYAEKLAIIFTFPLMVIVAIFSPKFSYLYSIKDLAQLKRIFNKSLVICFFSALVCLISFFIVYYFLYRLDNQKYDELSYFLVPFVLAQLINLLTGPSDILLSMVGKERLLLWLTVSSGFFSILLFYFALKFSTLLVAVYLLNIVYFLRNVIQFYYARVFLKDILVK